METREFEIKNELGIHARPASALVEIAGKFESDIKLIKDDINVDAKSIMGVMILAAPYGSTVTVKAEGSDEKEAVEAIAALIENNFNE
ncbi:MAG: HPr family phosphocarrier protein [Chitinivibrionales bacterium]